MRYLAIFLVFTLSNFGCNNEKKNYIEKNKKEVSFLDNTLETITISNLDSTQIPKTISFIGKFKEGLKWADSNGENIVFVTETGIFRDKKIKHEFEESDDAELHAYSFKLNKGEHEINWKINDFVRDCPVDIVAKFIDNSLKITDLNNNGIAEVWTIYKTACHGDVSPSEMKIIMFEGGQKFAVRGENKVKIGIDDAGKPLYIGGEYKMDEHFKKGPKVFTEFAKNLWNKNIIETWK